MHKHDSLPFAKLPTCAHRTIRACNHRILQGMLQTSAPALKPLRRSVVAYLDRIFILPALYPIKGSMRPTVLPSRTRTLAQLLHHSLDTAARQYKVYLPETASYSPSLDLSQMFPQSLAFAPASGGSLGALELWSTAHSCTPLGTYITPVFVGGHCQRHSSQGVAPKSQAIFSTG